MSSFENNTMDLEFSKEVSSEIKNVLRFFKREVLEGERVYLYLGEAVFKGLGNEGCSGALYSALLPMKRGKSALDAYETWDLHLGWGMPYADCNGRKKRYFRFGDQEKEPLVYYLSSPCGGYPKYVELSEELRLFFGLYELIESPKKRQYLRFSPTGEKIVVAEIDEDRVWVLRSFLMHYLYVRRKVLSVFWDVTRDDNSSKDEWSDTLSGENWRVIGGISKLGGSYFWMRGKLILKGKKFVPEKSRYVKFRVKNNEGRLVDFTCNPDKLADSFGKNRGAPHYTTPTFFSSEVLNKYYADTTKYGVEDATIRCHGCWSLRLDNSHDDCVCVALGDLGRDLPYEEQLYWKSFELKNPKSRTYSRTAWNRFFEAKFAAPQALDLLLKDRFSVFYEKWVAVFGWPLFLPLEEGDKHYFDGFHLLTAETNIKDFEAQVFALTKIFIDSLNERELAKRGKNLKKDPKGIDKFEAFLAGEFKVEVPDMILFFRRVQALRSSSIAHRKSSTPSTNVVEYFKLGQRSYGAILKTIVEGFLNTLGTMTSLCEKKARGETRFEDE